MQTPLCTAKNLECVSRIKVKKLACFQQCSGILITSYDQEDVEDRPINVVNSLVDKLAAYLSGKLSYYLKNMPTEFKGFFYLSLLDLYIHSFKS